MKQKLDALQQTLLEIGASVYQRDGDSEFAYTSVGDASTDEDATVAYDSGARSNFSDDSNLQPGETIRADYEPVD